MFLTSLFEEGGGKVRKNFFGGGVGERKEKRAIYFLSLFWARELNFFYIFINCCEKKVDFKDSSKNNVNEIKEVNWP